MSGERLAVFDEHEREIECSAMSPDGSRFATASADRHVRLWDTVPLWRRGAAAQQVAGLEEQMRERVERELAVGSAGQAFAAIRDDESLSRGLRPGTSPLRT